MKDLSAFLLSIGVFICAYLGFIISIWPYIIPYEVTVEEAAEPHSTLAFLGVGIAILLPVLLSYTAYSYYIFRGKAKAADEHY
jgi:cytochrome d ubiquinol oxidase subunit II